MAVKDTTHHRTLADAAEARTIVPEASHRHDHDHHGHDHHHEDDDHQHGHDHDYPLEWAEALRIAVVAIAAAAVWFEIGEPLYAISVIGFLIDGCLRARRLFDGASNHGDFGTQPNACG